VRIGVERAMDARTRHDSSRFFDVRFEDLVADPAGVVRNLSHHFDLPLAPDSAAQIQEYLGRKRADDRGQHKYDGRLYGLDRASVHQQYADYIRAFDIDTRPRGSRG
jgi:hypothetical protein